MPDNDWYIWHQDMNIKHFNVFILIFSKLIVPRSLWFNFFSWSSVKKKKITKIAIKSDIELQVLVESQYLKIAIHIESAHQNRDSIKSGHRYIVPALYTLYIYIYTAYIYVYFRIFCKTKGRKAIGLDQHLQHAEERVIII